MNYFGLTLSGNIKILDNGTYHFGIIADNAAILYIDGQMVCGSQWDSSDFASLNLKKGMHKIALAFYARERMHTRTWTVLAKFCQPRRTMAC